MTADEIINRLRQWMSTIEPGLGHHRLHSETFEFLQEIGVSPSKEHVLINGELGKSRIDIYVPCSEPPHLVIEIKATGDWREVAEAAWQLYQASILTEIATKRVAICGTPIPDKNLIPFLELIGVVPLQPAGTSVS